ncbi:hypothetical protein Tcan_10594 [Toxocara canis]|uniref:Uncharacterized protein n=1 Tax=Toxocara canis TaxID=6265 RepID=A0A0B2UU99_TOXCA|nr:hypothetical protein Tcan_10594 [Toxocara canis]
MMLRLIQFLAVVIVTSKCTADIMDSSSSNSIEVESQQGDAFVTPNQHLSGVKATVQRSADQYYPKRKYRNDPDNKPNQKIIEAISQRSTVSPGQNAIQTTLTEEVTPVDGSIPTTAKGFAVTKTFSATTTATPAATTMTATSTTLTTTTTTTATSTTTTTTTATVTTTITATTTTTTATSTTSTRVTATTTATAIITTATTLTTTTTTATSITTTTTTSTSTSSTTTTTTTTTSSTTTATTKTMTTMSSHPLVEKRCSKEAFHEDVNGSQPTGSSLSIRSALPLSHFGYDDQ